MDNSHTPEKYSNNRERRRKYTTAWNYSPICILMLKNAEITTFPAFHVSIFYTFINTPTLGF